MAQILVVDDEPGLRSFLAEVLTGDGHQVTSAKDGLEAAQLVDKKQFALVVSDLKMPGLDGMGLLRKLKAEQPEVEVVLLTAHGDIGTAVEAMRLGAFDFLQKPLADPDQLSLLCARALERRGLKTAVRAVKQTSLLALSYGDPAMDRVVHALQKVAPTLASVLILGESGVGKEVAARELHRLSDRAKGPFVAVNCAAISEQLLESELFGHEKGAFTGATERHQGRLELADGGTFFLDEVGELKQALQAKLLRVLQERRLERVGGTRSIELDVRFVAATNRDLADMVRQGTFREDLYHRLAVFPIAIPPLRERPGDLVPIAQTLLASIARELGRPGLSLDAAALLTIKARSWPGNVRELRNALERAAILSDGAVLDAEHLAPVGSTHGGTQGSASQQGHGSLADLERQAIVAALAAEGGNRRKVAERLGIAERTLYD
ncbi:MAG: sigma-54 dependent transcriptional regulator, partial [Polyangia bacterium]